MMKLRCRWSSGFALMLSVAIAAMFTTAGMSSPSAPDGLVEYSELATGQAAFVLRQQLNEYENISFQFVANKDLNTLLVRYVNHPDLYGVSTHNRTFSNFLEGYAFANEGILGAFFLDESTPNRMPLTMRESLPSSFLQSFRKSQTYSDVLKANGRPVWSTPIQVTPSGPEVIMLGRRIKHLFTDAPLGVLIILIRAHSLSQAVNDYLGSNFYFSVGTVKSNYITILDKAGRVISASNPGISGTVADIDKAAWLLAFRSQPRAVHSKPHAGGSFVVSIDQEDLLVSYRPIEETDWHVFVPILPRGVFRSSVLTTSKPATSTSVVKMVAAGIAASLAALLGFRSMHRPAVRPTTMDRTWPEPAKPAPECSNSPSSAGSTEEAALGCDWVGQLNPRERVILRLLAQGLSNKEIARHMFVAEQTVKNYVSVIYDKIGARDRVQASLMAVRAGLHSVDGLPNDMERKDQNPR